MDYYSDEIAQYDWRQNIPYASPAHQVTPDFGPWGVGYWIQGLPVQTTLEMIISAPPPFMKNHMFYDQGLAYRNTNVVVGQAPTAGVYTGVEDTCQ